MPAITRAMREISGNETTNQHKRYRDSEKYPTGTTAVYNTFVLISKPETMLERHITSVSTSGPTPGRDDWISVIIGFSTSIPAIILNELYQSYVVVDHTISQVSSGDTQHPLNRHAPQHDSNIISYFASTEPPEHWKIGFETLTQQYLDGSLSTGFFEKSLERIMTAVETLEEVQAKVEQKLEIELKKCGIPVIVPESFWRFLNGRARTLEIASMTLEQRLDEQPEQ